MQIFYTVLPGDTLNQIAARWGLPIESLIAANNLRQPFPIFVDQQLSVPQGVNRIRVQPGDTVFAIAQRFRVPVAVIIEANRLQPPYIIRVGQLLTVPPGVPYYSVKPGDNLYQIARRYNVVTDGNPRPDLIQQSNGLQSTIITPGMRLNIPYAPPGDQGLIAYTSDRGGNYDIWIYDPRTGGSEKLTNGFASSTSIPEWSPDSRFIAFVGNRGILYVIDIGTGVYSRIDQLEEGRLHNLDWSPNSSELAYEKQGQIVLYNVGTHRAQRINQPVATDVGWFPNGEELLFQAPDSAGISQLYRIRRDGTGKQQLTQNSNGPINNAKISPDGRYVLYTTPGVSISLIHILELATGNLVGISGGPLAKNYYPFWSPDSMQIAFSATANGERGYFSQIRTVRRDGESERIRAISNCFSTPVSWSINGRKIAYLSDCAEQEFANEMWVVDTSHPVPIRLIQEGRILALQWSPSALPEQQTALYKNIEYKVQFRYPANWQRVDAERYEGSDGFFAISAISGGESMDEVCQGEAFHLMMPYGSSPQIIRTRIQNQEACFIYPSDDQPTDMRRQSALIVLYPNPVQIQGTPYQYFILWADQPHINQIASTIQWGQSPATLTR